MFANGLLDDLEPALAVLTMVAMVAWYLRRSAGRYTKHGGRGRRARKLSARAEWICPNCNTPYAGSSRFCYTCKNWATIGDDPGTTQMMVLMGWLPALVAAVIGGFVATFVTREAGPLVIVLLAGSLLGWFTAVAFYFGAGQLWWRHGRSEGAAELLVITSWLGVGPAVPVLLTIVVTLAWM